MTDPDDAPTTRRRFVGGAAATAGLGGMAALAGCVGDIDPEGAPDRPSYGADPSQLDPGLEFIVRSVHYVNAYLDNGGSGLPDRPTYPGNLNQLDRELRFIIESLEYQTGYIEAEVG